jgi:hypothetical protein
MNNIYAKKESLITFTEMWIQAVMYTGAVMCINEVYIMINLLV